MEERWDKESFFPCVEFGVGVLSFKMIWLGAMIWMEGKVVG